MTNRALSMNGHFERGGGKNRLSVSQIHQKIF